MAEERKSPSQRLYGKTPRVRDTDDREAAPTAAAEAEPAPAAREPRRESKSEPAATPEEDVMAGTDGIPVHAHEQERERAELHHRHIQELHDLHHRHEREHLMRVTGHHHEKMAAMHDRHEEELRKLHTQHERERREMHDRHESMRDGGERTGRGPSGGATEKDEGKSGTEK